MFGKRGGPAAPEGFGEPVPPSSFIGSRIRIQGELRGDEDVLVEGRVEGRVEVSKAFRVGLRGVVLAEVAAGTVAIANARPFAPGRSSQRVWRRFSAGTSIV